MDQISKIAASILLNIKAVSLNAKQPFKYSSGILSPIYTDCRTLISFPNQRQEIRDLYIQAIKESGITFDVIAGTATAGIPHAAWIADGLELPMAYVRSKPKEHGKGNQIEGLINEGQNVAVIEDLISTGESSIESVRAIRSSNAKCNYVFAITTYGMQKSKDNFESNKVNLITLTNFQDLITAAQDLGYITNEEIPIILEWAKDPSSWGKKMGFE